MKNFHEEAQALRDEMVARRRDLHQHPELAFNEFRTAGIVAQALGELGLEVQTGVGKTGVVGVLEGGQDGMTVLVRCDMDALPILEDTGLAFQSQTTGKMHACGHDGHTSIGLAVAKMLHAQRDQIKGRVKFVFQPAEEIGQGAQAMIDDGVLSAPTPEISLGLHLWSEFPVGEVAMTSGSFMGGAAEFRIELTGNGGHAALPNNTVDPLIAAAHLVTALQTIISRNFDPRDNAVVSVTQLHAGEAFNVIPAKAHIGGTFRTFTRNERDVIVKRIEEIARGVAAGMGCQMELRFDELVPPLINDPTVTRDTLEQFKQTYPQLNYRTDFRTMVSEDMGIFLQHNPGLYFFVGAGPNYPHHHPKFDIDEEAMVIGASLLASAVSAYVF